MGLGTMELAPSEFWSLTLMEFWSIYNARFKKGPRPMSRNELEELMRKVPD